MTSLSTKFLGQPRLMKPIFMEVSYGAIRSFRAPCRPLSPTWFVTEALGTGKVHSITDSLKCLERRFVATRDASPL